MFKYLVISVLVCFEDKEYGLSFFKLINFKNSDLVGVRKRVRNILVKFVVYVFEFCKREF